MHNEDQATIKITNWITNPLYDQYQLQIQIGNNQYQLYLRYSQLRQLFKSIKHNNIKFPSRCCFAQTLMPLLPRSQKHQFIQTRFEDLTNYFDHISQELKLKQYRQFWQLVSKAQNWQNSIMMNTKYKAINLGKLIQENRNKLVYVCA